MSNLLFKVYHEVRFTHVLMYVPTYVYYV